MRTLLPIVTLFRCNGFNDVTFKLQGCLQKYNQVNWAEAYGSLLIEAMVPCVEILFPFTKVSTEYGSDILYVKERL